MKHLAPEIVATTATHMCSSIICHTLSHYNFSVTTMFTRPFCVLKRNPKLPKKGNLYPKIVFLTHVSCFIPNTIIVTKCSKISN